MRLSMQRTIPHLLIALLLLSSCASVPLQTTPTVTVAPVQTTPLSHTDARVTIGQPGSAIPGDFLGFSFEMAQLCQIVALDALHPQTYEALYRNLGSGVLHIGGHTSDLSTWNPGGTATCSTSSTTITTGLVDTFFAFVGRIGWHVTWGLNLAQNKAPQAAQEASYVAHVGKTSLLGFTIGNEPELYPHFGLRPAPWGYTDYRTEWERYRGAVLEAIPNAHFFGPDACCGFTFYGTFLTDEGKHLTAVSHHFYLTSNHTSFTTPVELLAPAVDQQFSRDVGRWNATAQLIGVPMELSETGTVSNSGNLGTSNTFVSALWSVSALFLGAQVGVRRIDFHNASHASYNAIADDGTPRPLYDGLLFFHRLTHGTHLAQAQIQTAQNIVAYAVAAGTSLHVILLNRESHTVSVTIDAGRAYHAIELVHLEAPSLSATTGVSLNERGGVWQGTQIQVTVPADSALGLEFS